MNPAKVQSEINGNKLVKKETFETLFIEMTWEPVLPRCQCRDSTQRDATRG